MTPIAISSKVRGAATRIAKPDGDEAAGAVSSKVFGKLASGQSL